MTASAAESSLSSAAPRAPRVEEVPCPLCGVKDARPRWRGHDRLTNVPGEYAVVECNRCGFLYQNPRPAVDELHWCYPRDYAAFNPAPAEGHKLLRGSGLDAEAHKYVLASRLGYRHLTPARAGLAVRARAWMRAARVRKLVFPMRGSGRLLDVGCSTGGRMSSLKSLGWRVAGIENSPEVAEIARREHDNVFAGDILDAKFPDGEFDMVTCFHVLEHVPDPRQVMSRMIRWLAPGGVLVVEVPNGASFGAWFFGTHWYLLDLPRHFHQFTPKTLTRLAEESGGVVREIEHHDSLGTWMGSLGHWDEDRARRAGREPRELGKKKWLKKLLRPFGHLTRWAKHGEVLRAFIEVKPRSGGGGTRPAP